MSTHKHTELDRRKISNKTVESYQSYCISQQILLTKKKCIKLIRLYSRVCVCVCVSGEYIVRLLHKWKKKIIYKPSISLCECVFGWLGVTWPTVARCTRFKYCSHIQIDALRCIPILNERTSTEYCTHQQTHARARSDEEHTNSQSKHGMHTETVLKCITFLYEMLRTTALIHCGFVVRNYITWHHWLPVNDQVHKHCLHTSCASIQRIFYYVVYAWHYMLTLKIKREKKFKKVCRYRTSYISQVHYAIGWTEDIQSKKKKQNYG